MPEIMMQSRAQNAVQRESGEMPSAIQSPVRKSNAGIAVTARDGSQII